MKPTLREEMASEMHEIWKHWMTYLFSQCQQWDDGEMSIPADLVERWTRQMNTPYFGLPEDEKESDRRQADKIQHVIYKFAVEKGLWEP